ncbi:aminomethyl transferase family protein [Pararhodobacter zhoushanensis]|uniref:Aminomethyl transferase family protein n=1 Tax=Pararhodobacter zhoushanensis TaxID=2479545 RepID=A0ABT3GV47_9RHOB|nr:aminomethyl transferase family protein [Pararhodobacter zhoushanensis]MCW1931408.1 aminomethyl transferase family protein [Pararhodobacter zhoushanensis]
MNKPQTFAPATLQDALDTAGGAINLLRSSQLGTTIFPGIPAEFTNWRDEQRAWKDSVALLEQTYHMTEVYVRGADALEFMSRLSTNRHDNFTTMRAKQVVMCGPDGRMISDAVVFREEDDFMRVVGPPTAANWVEFNATKTDLNVTTTRDENFIRPRARRDVFRFQVQGPNALPLMQEVTDGTLPDIKFFHMGAFKIAGRDVRAVRHGMAGTPGFEVYGDWADQAAVREAVERVGAKYKLRKAGSVTYGTAAQESGWMPRPLPAIYETDDMAEYRAWIPAQSFEAAGSLGGSYISDKIADYYVEPYEVGYGSLVNFDHDFIGRAALEELKLNQKRRKMTLIWNNDDVFRVLKNSLRTDGPRTKFISLPVPMYSSFQADQVLSGGKPVGVSNWMSYSSNAGAVLSTALMDIEHAVVGNEVTLLWGEPDSRRSTVEEHELTEIRATIAPVPYYDKTIKKD